MAELQAKEETVPPVTAPVPTPAPAPAPVPAAPKLAEAPPHDVADKKAAALPPPPAAEETKALVVVDNESEFVSIFFLPPMFKFSIFWVLEIMGCCQNSIFYRVSLLGDSLVYEKKF